MQRNARVVKVNVDDNPSISQRYGIKGIPTLILFKGGKEEERVVGATSKEAISRMIDKHVARRRDCLSRYEFRRGLSD